MIICVICGKKIPTQLRVEPQKPTFILDNYGL